jgi:CheY-like chemotaxis protein
MCRVFPYIIAISPSLSYLSREHGRPMETSGLVAHGPGITITGSLSMKTVLLIDDDNTFLLTIGVRLKSMGYTVCAAKDAASAISVVRKTNPDVIVLDVSLPGGDGFLVAERLRNIVAVAATPIIFVTASVKPGLRERAIKLGAVGFLAKPFDAATLAEALESAISPLDVRQPLADEA